MDDLINSLSKLDLNEKNIINTIIIKNDSFDNIIQSFEKITISESYKKLENLELSDNFQNTLKKFIDFFKILRSKQKCFIKEDTVIPKWIY